jgi:uncharacterized protein YjbJ (UPF0337 family)
MLNDEQIKDKWSEIKGGVQNLWGHFTDDDLEKTKGNITKLSELIQSRYDETKDSVKEKLDKLFASFENETDLKQHDVGSTSYQRSPLTDASERSFTIDRSDKNAVYYTFHT